MSCELSCCRPTLLPRRWWDAGRHERSVPCRLVVDLGPLLRDVGGTQEGTNRTEVARFGNKLDVNPFSLKRKTQCRPLYALFDVCGISSSKLTYSVNTL